MKTAKFKTLVASAMVAAAALALAPNASATHFRGGNASWVITSSNATNTTVQFSVTTYWRGNAFGYSGGSFPPANGETFNPGGAGGTATVISANTTENIVGGVQTYTRTYATGSTVTQNHLNNCCRISSLQNGQNDDPYRLDSTLVLNGNVGPTLGINSPILNLAVGGLQTFQLSANDPENDAITWASATSAQSGMSPTNPFIGANVLSISSGGLLSWDTTGGVVGNLYAFQAIATDSNGNSNPFDFIIRLCQSGTSGCGQFIPPSAPEPGPLALVALGLVALTLRRHLARR